MVWNHAFHFKVFYYFMDFVYLVLEYIFWLQYEDPVGQEAARKTVPVCELEEKALVSLAKVSLYCTASAIFFFFSLPLPLSLNFFFLVWFQDKMHFVLLLLISLQQVYLDFLKIMYTNCYVAFHVLRDRCSEILTNGCLVGREF